MAKRQTAATPEPAVDPRSPDVVLHYTGGPIFGLAPARDLNGSDLARIARIEALMASGGMPVEPATPDELAALVARLEASGAFSRTPAPELDAPEAPAEPAEETVA